MSRDRLPSTLCTWLAMTAASCSGPTAPTDLTVSRFVQTLQERGLTVTMEGSISPSANRFFSVPAQQIVINGSRVSAFEYPSVEAASLEASSVSPDAQPSPTAMFSWVSTPRFYRQDRLIVFYVGCSAELIRALDDVMAPPFVIGPTPCRD